MEKIISLFQRNYETDRLARDEVVPGAEWVLAGEGVATRKFDGTCCMVKDGQLFKRYDFKPQNFKAIKRALKSNSQVPEAIWGERPHGWIAAEESPNSVTYHWPGWLLVGDGPDDKYHREAFAGNEQNGTYELCGPKIQSNPECFESHVLIPHGKEILDAPITFNALREWFKDKDIEGVVWHHEDRRMVKIKKKDFGMSRTKAAKSE